jgi:hypothetical protein
MRRRRLSLTCITGVVSSLVTSSRWSK